MEIYKKIAAIMKDCGPIAKDRTNRGQGFKFRGIDDVMNSLHSIFAKHSVFIIHEVLERVVTEKRTAKGGVLYSVVLKIRFKLTSDDGSFVEIINFGEATDSGDKATNKALSVSLKYALLQLLLIPTEEEKDPDYIIPPKTIPKKEVPKPKTLTNERLQKALNLLGEEPVKTVQSLLLFSLSEAQKKVLIQAIVDLEVKGKIKSDDRIIINSIL